MNIFRDWSLEMMAQGIYARSLLEAATIGAGDFFMRRVASLMWTLAFVEVGNSWTTMVTFGIWG